MVPVPVFENLRKGGPVSVPVSSNMDEKLDQTGLPSTRHQGVFWLHECEETQERPLNLLLSLLLSLGLQFQAFLHSVVSFGEV